MKIRDETNTNIARRDADEVASTGPATRVPVAPSIETGPDVLRRRTFESQAQCCVAQFTHSAEPPRFRVGTLGGFQLFQRDRPVQFARKTPQKPLRLLKLLIASNGGRVSTQAACDALWPDLSGDDAQRAFAVTLLRLRSLLSDARAVELRAGQAQLDPTYVRSDVADFQRQIALWRETGGAEDREATLRILDIYRGAFLEEELDAPWVLRMRERLRSQYTQFVGTTARQLREAGEIDGAISLYLRGLEADDLSESLYRGLMHCYLEGGLRGEAMAVYRRLRQVYSVVLGIAPSAETVSLFDGIRA